MGREMERERGDGERLREETLIFKVLTVLILRLVYFVSLFSVFYSLCQSIFVSPWLSLSLLPILLN